MNAGPEPSLMKTLWPTCVTIVSRITAGTRNNRLVTRHAQYSWSLLAEIKRSTEIYKHMPHFFVEFPFWVTKYGILSGNPVYCSFSACCFNQIDFKVQPGFNVLSWFWNNLFQPEIPGCNTEFHRTTSCTYDAIKRTLTRKFSAVVNALLVAHQTISWC